MLVQDVVKPPQVPPEAFSWGELYSALAPYAPHIIGAVIVFFVFNRLRKPLRLLFTQSKNIVAGLSPGAIAVSALIAGPLAAWHLGQDYGAYGVASAFSGMGATFVIGTIGQIRNWYRVPTRAAAKSARDDINLALTYPPDARGEIETALRRAKSILDKSVS